MTSVAKSSDTTSIPNGLSLAKNDIKIPENPKPRKKDCVIRLSMPALTMKPQIPDKNPDTIGVINRGCITAEFSSPADRQKIGKAMVN